MIDQSRPWSKGQILTVNGVATYKATSGASFKPYCPPDTEEPAEPSPPEPVIIQEAYCGGDQLPDKLTGFVNVCLFNGQTVTIAGGDTVPADINGFVFIDEKTCKPKFAMGIVKPPEPAEPIEPYIPVQETFCPGETLPDRMVGIVNACLVDGADVILAAGQTVPNDLDGCINIDEVSNRAAFQQNPVKDTDTFLVFEEVRDAILALVPPDTDTDTQRTDEEIETLAKAVFEVCDESDEIKTKAQVTACIEAWFELNHDDDDPYDTLEELKPVIESCLPIAKVFRYVEFDPSIHVAGDFVGAGTASDPCQIPLPPGVVKELFCAGETLPDRTVGVIVIDVNGAEISLVAGDQIPAATQGCIFVDESDGIADCIPNKVDGVVLEQELFKANDTLPIDMIGSVTVCVRAADGTLSLVDLDAGDTVPGTIEGCVIVDEQSNRPAFTQVPVKPTAVVAKQTCTVELVKTAPILTAAPAVGDVVEFSVCLINAGNQPLTNLLVSDLLPGGAPNPGATVNGSPVAGLAVGASDYSVTIEYTVTQADIDAGGIVNIAKVAATDPNGNTIYSADDAEVIFAEPPVIEPECDPIKISGEIAAHTLVGCVPQTSTLLLDAEDVGRGSEGFAVATPQSAIPQLLAGTLSVPVPVGQCNPGDVLVLHVTSGSNVDPGGVLPSSLGLLNVSNASPAGTLGAVTNISSHESNWAWNDQVFGFEVTGSAAANVILSAPNAVASTDRGVVNWHWICISASNGPVTLSNLNLANLSENIQTGVVNTQTGSTGPDFTVPADCPALALSGGRHIRHNDAGNTEVIHDTDWGTYSSGTELYDTASEDRPNQQTPCQVGQTSAWVLPGTTYNYTGFSNINSGWSVPERWRTIQIPFNCETVICEPADPAPEFSFDYASPEWPRSACKTITINSALFDVAPGDFVSVVPVINGVDYCPGKVDCDNSAGVAPIAETKDIDFKIDLNDLPAFGSGTCTVSFRMDVLFGDGAESSVTLPVGEVCIDLEPI